MPVRIYDIAKKLGIESKDVLAKANVNLRVTRDYLLPKLVSGEVDVSELDVALPPAED